MRPARRRSGRARPTTAATSSRPAPGSTVEVVAGSCPCSIWDDSVTPPLEYGPGRRRARGQVPLRRRRRDHRPPLLQGPGQHRHPRRAPLDGVRHPAGARPRSPARAHRAGRRSSSTRRWRSTPTRPTSPPTTRPTAATPPPTATSPARAPTPRRCTRSPTASTARTASTTTDRQGPSRPTPSRRATTGSTSSSTTRSARTPRRRRSASSLRPQGSSGIGTGTNVTATFNEAMDADDDQRRQLRAARRLERARPGDRHLLGGDPHGDPRPEQRAGELDHLHGDDQGRGRRRHRHGRQPARLRSHLVVHDGRRPAAAARRGAGRADPGDRQLGESVQPLLRRDPARRGAERVQRHRPLRRRRGRARRLRRRHPRRDRARARRRRRCSPTGSRAAAT